MKQLIQVMMMHFVHGTEMKHHQEEGNVYENAKLMMTAYQQGSDVFVMVFVVGVVSDLVSHLIKSNMTNYRLFRFEL